MTRKAQATLEFALVFVIVAFLIMGLLGLWRWSKDNMGARQGAFENSRVSAGTKTSPGQPEVSFYAGSPGEPQMLR